MRSITSTILKVLLGGWLVLAPNKILANSYAPGNVSIDEILDQSESVIDSQKYDENKKKRILDGNALMIYDILMDDYNKGTLDYGRWKKSVDHLNELSSTGYLDNNEVMKVLNFKTNKMVSAVEGKKNDQVSKNNKNKSLGHNLDYNDDKVFDFLNEEFNNENSVLEEIINSKENRTSYYDGSPFLEEGDFLDIVSSKGMDLLRFIMDEPDKQDLDDNKIVKKRKVIIKKGVKPRYGSKLSTYDLYKNLANPLKGDVEITSAWGLRPYPVKGRNRGKPQFHNGVDLVSRIGNNSVYSAQEGKIIYIGWRGGNGNSVIIEDETGLRTYYNHLKGYARNLKTGTKVKKGQIIAKYGSTGKVTGDHLHFAVAFNGEYVNPLYSKSEITETYVEENNNNNDYDSEQVDDSFFKGFKEKVKGSLVELGDSLDKKVLHSDPEHDERVKNFINTYVGDGSSWNVDENIPDFWDNFKQENKKAFGSTWEKAKEMYNVVKKESYKTIDLIIEKYATNDIVNADLSVSNRVEEIRDILYDTSLDEKKKADMIASHVVGIGYTIRDEDAPEKIAEYKIMLNALGGDLNGYYKDKKELGRNAKAIMFLANEYSTLSDIFSRNLKKK